MQKVTESHLKKNLTATTTITGITSLTGIFVAQASSTPTIKVADVTGTIINTFIPLAGSYYPMPCDVDGKQLTVTISGTVDCTVFFSF